jgi:hypothetical protein
LCSLDDTTLEVKLQAHSPPEVVQVVVTHDLLLLAKPPYQIERSCADPDAGRACDDEPQRLRGLAAALLYQVEQLPIAGPHVQACT